MKSPSPIRRMRPGAALSALALLGTLFWGGAANAAGTAAGTSIDNLATLQYSVGGAAQTAIGSSATGNTSGAGTVTSFVVDNKVNLTLVEATGSVTNVTLNSANNATKFTLTNTGNSPQGFNLTAANFAGGTIAGTADTIDVTITGIFYDTNGNGSYDAGTDLAVTANNVPTLAADVSVTLFVVATAPATAAQLAQANVTLTAVATTNNTNTPVVESGANTAGVDIVFADAATVEANFVGASAQRDATAVARSAYRIQAPILTVSKTSTLLCDPFNGITNPKNIPGAMVRWTVTVANTGTASATLTSIGDTLAAATTHDANLVAPTNAATCSSATGVAETAAGRGFQMEYSVAAAVRPLGGNAGSGYMTNAADADGATIAGQVVTIDFLTALPAGGTGAYAAGEIRAGETATITFNVTIN
jgi:hypothetical protein